MDGIHQARVADAFWRCSSCSPNRKEYVKVMGTSHKNAGALRGYIFQLLELFRKGLACLSLRFKGTSTFSYGASVHPLLDSRAVAAFVEVSPFASSESKCTCEWSMNI